MKPFKSALFLIAMLVVSTVPAHAAPPACEGTGVQPGGVEIQGAVRVAAGSNGDCTFASAERRDVDCRALPITAGVRGITAYWEPLGCAAAAELQAPVTGSGCNPRLVLGAPGGGIYVIVGPGCPPVEICDPWIPRVCEYGP